MLLCSAWVRDGKLPDDDIQLSRLARCDSETWNRIKPVLMPFFEVENGAWIQRRLLSEKEKAIKRSEARSRVGKMGGRPSCKTDSLSNSLTNSFEFAKANGKQNETPSQSQSQYIKTPIVPLQGTLGWRVGKLFNRREATAWSEKEIKALKSVEKLNTTEDEILALEAYYTADMPSGKDYRRRDILTLLNNWNGEIDRAKAFKASPPPLEPRANPQQLRSQILVLEETIGKHPANRDSIYHKPDCTPAQKENLKSLRCRLESLRAELGGLNGD